MAKIIFTGMHLRKIREIFEGTGLSAEEATGTGSLIISYRGEKITHKRANEIIEDYRRRRGISPGDDGSSGAPVASSSGVPPRRPTRPVGATTNPAPSGGRNEMEIPLVISKSEFKRRCKNSSGRDQFTGAQIERLTRGLRNIFGVIEANGWRWRNGGPDRKTATYITGDEVYEILIYAGRIQRPA